jgi:uncharacterized membrane protein
MVRLMATDANKGSPLARDQGSRAAAPSRSRRIFQYVPVSSLLGIAAGISVDQTDETDKALRLTVVTAREFLVGSAALGAAFGAIVIAVLALVSIWFDKTYLGVLDQKGGWDYAMRPFRVTGTVSVLTTLVAVVGLILFPAAGLLFRSLILGITGGLLTWSIFGTLVMISLLFEHGHERAELMDDVERAKVLSKILDLQARVESGELTSEKFQSQRDQLIQTFNERQQRLLRDELDAATAAPPPTAAPPTPSPPPSNGA